MIPTDGPPAPFGSVPQPGKVLPVAEPPRHGLLQASQSLLTIIVVALFIITFTVQPFRIPSESMEPTLLVGDFLLVNKQVGGPSAPVFSPAASIHRGDLVVFHYPVDPSLHLVKRVVGLPGDHLRLRQGRVYINDQPLNEPYALFRPAAPDPYRDDFPRTQSADPSVDPRWWVQMHTLVSNGELAIPPGNYFVLGDNRNNSEDSRYWGLVPRAAIVGKPFLIYFSLRSSEPSSFPASAAFTPGTVASRHEGPLDSIAGFARWDRAMHVIY